MKLRNYLLALFTMLITLGLYGQAPQSFKYQAVARDLLGAPIQLQPVKLKVSILKTTSSGDVVYSETHTAVTNQFGLVNLEIGTGDIVSGTFESVQWGIDEHFLQLEMDPTGGNSFQMMGTSQLLSVPYALFSGNGVQFDPNMVCNENTEGTIRYNFDTKVIEFCDGSGWVELGSGVGPHNCGNPLIDVRDGQVYATVQIGSQCWMKDNLNYGTYTESIFDNTQHSDVSNNGIVEKYAYDNDINNYALIGGLYDWNEMMGYQNVEGSQGICPDGWHVPSREELGELIDEVGGVGVAGAALMVGGSSGFEFPILGTRTAKGGFSVGGDGGLWTSTISLSHPTERAYNVAFNDATPNVQTATDVMFVGKSCRCLKD